MEKLWDGKKNLKYYQNWELFINYVILKIYSLDPQIFIPKNFLDEKNQNYVKILKFVPLKSMT